MLIFLGDVGNPLLNGGHPGIKGHKEALERRAQAVDVVNSLFQHQGHHRVDTVLVGLCHIAGIGGLEILLVAGELSGQLVDDRQLPLRQVLHRLDLVGVRIIKVCGREPLKQLDRVAIFAVDDHFFRLHQLQGLVQEVAHGVGMDELPLAVPQIGLQPVGQLVRRHGVAGCLEHGVRHGVGGVLTALDNHRPVLLDLMICLLEGLPGVLAALQAGNQRHGLLLLGIQVALARGLVPGDLGHQGSHVLRPLFGDLGQAVIVKNGAGIHNGPGKRVFVVGHGLHCGDVVCGRVGILHADSLGPHGGVSAAELLVHIVEHQPLPGHALLGPVQRNVLLDVIHGVD